MSKEEENTSQQEIPEKKEQNAQEMMNRAENTKDIRRLADELKEHLAKIEAETQQAALEAEEKARKAQEALDKVAQANLAVKEAQEEQQRAERFMQEMAQKAKNMRREAAQASLEKIEQDITDLNEEIRVLEETIASLNENLQQVTAKVKEKEEIFEQKEKEAETLQEQSEAAQEEAQRKIATAEAAKAQAAAAKAMLEEANLVQKNMQNEFAQKQEMMALAKTQMEQHHQLKEEAAQMVAKLEEEIAAAPTLSAEEKNGQIKVISKDDLGAKEEKRSRKKEQKKSSGFLNLLVFIMIGIALAFIVRSYFFQLADIKGTSMEPTIWDGNRIVISKIAYSMGPVQRGDIALLHAPSRMDDYFIKRVIALPGDHIEIKEGQVYLNDELLSEPYLREHTKTLGNINTIVPEDCYFVMGDNREASYDSRFDTLGFIARDEVIGKAIYRIYPFEQWGNLQTPLEGMLEPTGEENDDPSEQELNNDNDDNDNGNAEQQQNPQEPNSEPQNGNSSGQAAA